MYCLNCGVQLPDEANFCFKCSHPVYDGIPFREAAAAPTIIINQPKQKAVSASGIFEAFFAVILLAALVFGGFYYYQKYLNDKPLFQINKDGSTELNLR